LQNVPLNVGVITAVDELIDDEYDELTIKEEKAAALPDVMTFFQLGIIHCFLR
jgi:hypothetical protein